MNKITDETLINAYKPYDIVTDEKGNVGFIQEVNLNECQDEPKHQISYAVEWIVGKGNKHAWFKHEELTKHCNLFVKIAQASCHPFGGNEHKTKELMSKGI